MKYQQVPLTRLSSAGTRLDKDGQWHAFGTAGGAWYRVQGRVVQRVTLEAGEDEALLRLFDACGPLPSKALKEGFREELTFRVHDDTYLLSGMLLRFFIGWDVLARVGRDLGVAIRFFGGNSLEYTVSFDEWTPSAMTAAVVTAKAFAMVGSSLAQDSKQGIPHTEAEVIGLLRTARDFLSEEIGPQEKSPPVRAAQQQQQSLFPD